MPDLTRTPPLALMYHSVTANGDDPYHITVSPRRFAAQMRWLRRSGLRGVSMRELIRAGNRGAARRLVGLTFDDGYADFLGEALPILAQHGFTATAYVVAGRLGGYNDWEQDGPAKALMTVDQLREAADRGVEIGSHSMTHAHLEDADPGDLKVEIQESRDLLESVLGRAIDGFCYPYGELSDPVLRATREAGYDYAVATWQMARHDRHALPRTYAGERDWAGRLVAKRIRHWLTWGRRR
jgi:peptidoglycan/xylan/chitin deacetylase (PgdA/CDA1 family)